MHYVRDAKNYIVILSRGDELIASLTAFAKKQELKDIWLQGGIGACMNATLGSYSIETKQYSWKQFDTPHEIASMQGNMTYIDDNPFWHIHATLGGPELMAVAGHIKTLVVGLTCEIYLSVVETPLHRSLDMQTGLKLLKPIDGQ